MDKRATIFVGSGNRIQSFELQANGSLRRLTEFPFPGVSPGWFAFDRETSKLFVTDGLGPKLAVYDLNLQTKELRLTNVHRFVSNAVHLHLQKSHKGLELAGASYDHATYGRYRANSNAENVEYTHGIRYVGEAKTHSSSFDPRRNLVFVSNLGDNEIHVYRIDGSELIKCAGIRLPNPRIVHYDAHFDRVFVTTEAYSNKSYVKVYSIKDGLNGDPGLTERSSFEMALSGGDLKINYENRYLAATVREEGREGLWLLPLNSEGHLDPSRGRHHVPIPHLKPRSLQVTSDGRHFIVACDDPKNKKDLVVIRAVFDGSGRNVVGAEIVDSLKLSAAPVLANFLIE